MILRILLFIAASWLLCAGCGRERAYPPVVGTWLVRIPEAPFSDHLFTFHADGTVIQANPDAGDPNSSDSNLMGAWTTSGPVVRGKLVEITADRESRKFLSRGEISIELKVVADTLKGTAEARFFDREDHLVRGPIQATLSGRRIVP